MKIEISENFVLIEDNHGNQVVFDESETDLFFDQMEEAIYNATSKLLDGSLGKSNGS